MSETIPPSSPLSWPPSSPAAQDTSCRSPSREHFAGATAETEVTTASTSKAASEEETKRISKCMKTSDLADNRAPSSPKKRNREDDDDNNIVSPPAKKADESKSRGKATAQKSDPSKATPKKGRVKREFAPPPPSTRPSRTRKAPERFEDLQEAKPIIAPPLKKGRSKVFDPNFITTNSTSRLGKADVYHMLLEPAAWTSLSADQQSILLAMLPQEARNTALLERVKKGETEGTRPSAFTLSNDCFRTDVAKFQEDLTNGHLAKTWQVAAEQAAVDRAAGEFDQWKAEEAELWWGQKSNRPT